MFPTFSTLNTPLDAPMWFFNITAQVNSVNYLLAFVLNDSAVHCTLVGRKTLTQSFPKNKGKKPLENTHTHTHTHKPKTHLFGSQFTSKTEISSHFHTQLNAKPPHIYYIWFRNRSSISMHVTLNRYTISLHLSSSFWFIQTPACAILSLLTTNLNQAMQCRMLKTSCRHFQRCNSASVLMVK